MVGQLLIQKYIENSSLDNLSHSLMLIGPKGCGKHLVANLIGEKLGIQVIDATQLLNTEFIENIYLQVEPKLYILDINSLSIKEQNMVLKLVEQPFKNTYLVLLASDKDVPITTLKNRCSILKFDPYSREELKMFSKEREDSLAFCSTPGEVLNIISVDIDPIKELCSKIIDKIDIASIPNTLSLSDKISFKDEKNKIDLNCFNIILKKYLEYLALKRKDLNILNHYYNYLKKISLKNINKKMVFENMLLILKEDLS